MPELKHTEILKELKSGTYHPVYFLQGAETHFIDLVSDYITEHALTDAEKGFNQTILYGKDVEAASLIDTLMRYPMMANRQVVVLKEAQEFKDIETLEAYFNKPTPTTVFVVCHKHKAVRKNSKLLKPVIANGVLLQAEKIKDYQLAPYIRDAAKTHKLAMDEAVVNLLMQYLGSDLSKIEKQLEKLALNVEPGKPVTTADIEKYIGISKDYNVFEFVNALAHRNTARAYQIVNYFINNPKDNHPVMIIGFLYSFFSKAYAYQSVKGQMDKNAMSKIGSNFMQLKDIKAFNQNYPGPAAEEAIMILHEYDLKAKGVDYPNSDKSALLKEMVFKMMV